VDNVNIDLKEIRPEGVYWINIPHNGARWWALVNTVNNTGSNKAGNFLIS
jgi:uncharacterized protein YraI